MSKIVVGLGGLLSDPACCIVKNGQLVAAVEQAKVARQDRPGSFPDEALSIALEISGVKASDNTTMPTPPPPTTHRDFHRRPY